MHRFSTVQKVSALSPCGVQGSMAILPILSLPAMSMPSSSPLGGQTYASKGCEYYNSCRERVRNQFGV